MLRVNEVELALEHLMACRSKERIFIEMVEEKGFTKAYTSLVKSIWNYSYGAVPAVLSTPWSRIDITVILNRLTYRNTGHYCSYPLVETTASQILRRYPAARVAKMCRALNKNMKRQWP